MANRAFKVPDEIGNFESDYTSKDWMAKEGEYVGKIVEYAKTKGSGTHKGLQVALPMGDGHALYVILTTSPLQLIHVPIGDKWHNPLINQLTAAAVKKMAFKYDASDYTY
jgi:hypothetical protein